MPRWVPVSPRLADSSADASSGSRNNAVNSNNNLMSDKLVGEMLLVESLETNDSNGQEGEKGYLDLGLPEQNIRMMQASSNKESLLLLLQERILRVSKPVSSLQDNQVSSSSNASSIGKRKSNTESMVFNDQSRKKTKTSATSSVPTSIQEEQPSLVATNLDIPTLSSSSNETDSPLFITIKTHSQVKEDYTWLSSLQPSTIILYDADVEVIRNIEAYQSTIPTQQLKLYFLVYEGSTEEHRYVGSLAKEKKAFESLISTKEHMVISLPDHPFDVQQAKDADKALALDSRTLNKSKSLFKEGRKVVIDVREFRSTLPSILYTSGFQIVPRTINVGDYILSPEICIERKGISDLFQSFASGRLYNQVESMSRYYKYPCLLIEFSPEKPFCFMVRAERHVFFFVFFFQADIHFIFLLGTQ